MALTGLEPTSLREAAADPAFLVGVMDYLVADESLLLAFGAETGLDPAAIAGDHAARLHR